MKDWFRNILFSDYDQDPRFIILVRTVLGIAAVSGLGMAISLSLFPVAKINWLTVGIVFSIDFLTFLFLGLTYRQILWPGKLFLPLSMLVAVPYIAATQANGLHDSSITLFPVMIVVAGLLLGQKIIPLVTILSFLGTWSVAYYDMAGFNKSIIASRTGFDDIIVITLGQVITAGALSGLMTRLNRVLNQTRANEQAQIAANQELRVLQTTLEERIEERTAELTVRTQELVQLSESLERRASRFQAITEVSQVISELGGQLVDVLPRIANIVSQQFNFYHVGIFLLDEHGEYAVLQAANSEGGKRMLARQHKLRVGSEGIVGFVSHSGTSRVALDIGEDAVFFDNPDLPETCSEMALPLRSGERIIGALDIQSTEPNAFRSEDIEALNVLAGQVGIAIENARLYEEAQRSLNESERIYRQYIRQEYAMLARSRKERGFIYDRFELRPIDVPLTNSEIKEAVATGEVRVVESQQGMRLAVPIKVRKQVIGVLNIDAKGPNKIDPDNLDVIAAIVERMGLALESARLLEDSQRRAAKEQQIGEISAKIGASINLRNILQTAVEELGRALPGSEVLIQFDNDGK